MKIFFTSFTILFLASVCFLPVLHNAFAADGSSVDLLKTNLGGVGGGMGEGDVDAVGGTLTAKVGSIIKVVVGLLGVVLTCLIIYGGFLWMTAGGDPGQVKKAKGYITDAIIGLIICILAYAITSFVILKIGSAIK